MEENQVMSIFKEWPGSSNIKSTTYFPGTGALVVTFKNEQVYKYDGVPMDIWPELIAAESIGSFLAKFVKPKFKGAKLIKEVSNE